MQRIYSFAWLPFCNKSKRWSLSIQEGQPSSLENKGLYIKLNIQLSNAGENLSLEPYKNKWEAQRDTGWQLEDSISVNKKAIFIHFPGHGEACWPIDRIYLLDILNIKLFMEVMVGRELTSTKTLSQPCESLSAI